MNKKIILFIPIIATIIILSIIYLLSPIKLVLVDNDEINITYNTTYKEPGAFAKKMFFKLKNEIIITNNVNVSSLGKYTVDYQIKNTEIKKKRIVNVIDDIKPKLSLNGDINYTMFKDEEYIEQGYSATDNFDGDITKQVIITDNIENEDLGEFQINYKVCDSNNNCSETTRKVNIIKGDILYGNYRNNNVDSYYQSTLKLRGSDRTFIFKVNLCEGMGTIKGTYTIENGNIFLHVTEKDCSGFIGIDNDTYRFSLAEEDTLKYESNYIACSPQSNDLFVKYR